MPSDVVQETTLLKGNTLSRQRGSGHLVGRDWYRTLSRAIPSHLIGPRLTCKPHPRGVDMGQHLSFISCGKAVGGKPRSEPDSGNPSVRDRRGSCGNVGYGEG